MRRICVFCGSSPGADPAYRSCARELGALLADNGLGLVYGGGNVGLMGEIANAALERRGEVIGVIPRSLADRELAHTGVTDLRVVGSMHERKAVMAELADAFIALPGGLGTLEEFCEVLTWAQLGFHGKPCGLLDVRSYYAPLIRFFDEAVRQRFLTQEHRDMILVDEDPRSLLRRFAAHVAPVVEKWIDREET
jgi:uncharacterized protein (TIGR00730 family)